MGDAYTPGLTVTGHTSLRKTRRCGGTVALISIGVIVLALLVWEQRDKTAERKSVTED